MSTDLDSSFETWAIVEISGHVTLAGFVTETQIAGHGFLKIDIPKAGNRPEFSRFIGPSFIYGITPCDEKIARLVAMRQAIPHQSLLSPSSDQYDD